VPAKKRSTTFLILMAVLIALILYAVNASDRRECQALYARARTHRDTLNVDITHMSWRRPSCFKLVRS